MTYNQWVELFKQFAINNQFINSYYHGESALRHSERDIKYPFMHMMYTGSTYEDTAEVASFEVFFMDLPTKKKGENEQEAGLTSDMKQCAEDLLAELRNGMTVFLWGDKVTIISARINPLVDEEQHTVTGVSLELSLEVPYTADTCISPLVPPPPSGTCLPATYTNGQGFEVSIPSGDTYTAPQIMVTEVDGEVGQQAANTDVVCEWSTLQLGTSDNEIFPPSFNITSYPAGGVVEVPNNLFQDGSGFNQQRPFRFRVRVMNAEIDDVVTTGGAGDANQITLELLDILNSDGLVLLSLPDFIGNKTLSDTPLTDDNGAVGSYPVPTSIVIDGEVSSANYAAGVLTIETDCPPPPAPTDIAPMPIMATVITSYDVGDEGWRIAQGEFDYPTGNYLAVQQVDYAAATPFITLKHSLLVVAKNRFTDSSDNALAYGDATPADGIVKDWLTRKMYAVDRLSFSSSGGLNAYENALATIQATTFGGFSDWRMPIRTEINSLFDHENPNLLSNINGRPPGFTNNSLFGTSTGTTNGFASTQCYRLFGNGTRQGSFANKAIATVFSIMVRNF